jgi:hypothetical protein
MQDWKDIFSHVHQTKMRLGALNLGLGPYDASNDLRVFVLFPPYQSIKRIAYH